MCWACGLRGHNVFTQRRGTGPTELGDAPLRLHPAQVVVLKIPVPNQRDVLQPHPVKQVIRLAVHAQYPEREAVIAVDQRLVQGKALIEVVTVEERVQKM